jgi:hypothetical protein
MYDMWFNNGLQLSNLIKRKKMKTLLYNAKLTNLKVPLSIPKRKKGTIDVIASCSLSGHGQYNGVDFMSYLQPFARSVCDKDLPMTISENIFKEHNFKNIQLGIEFDYHLDRSTPNFEPSFFELPCYYATHVSKGRKDLSMGIRVPIRIQLANFVGVGELQVELLSPKIKFFEDLLDSVQRYFGVRIYPISNIEECNDDNDMIDSGKSLKEYMSMLPKMRILKDVSKSGKASVKSKDVYNMYETVSEVIW